METNSVHGNTSKFVALTKTGGSIYGICRTTVSAWKSALVGETAEASLFILKTIDESRKDFANRCKDELGMPLDHPLWGDDK